MRVLKPAQQGWVSVRRNAGARQRRAGQSERIRRTIQAVEGQRLAESVFREEFAVVAQVAEALQGRWGQVSVLAVGWVCHPEANWPMQKGAHHCHQGANLQGGGQCRDVILRHSWAGDAAGAQAGMQAHRFDRTAKADLGARGLCSLRALQPQRHTRGFIRAADSAKQSPTTGQALLAAASSIAQPLCHSPPLCCLLGWR